MAKKPNQQRSRKAEIDPDENASRDNEGKAELSYMLEFPYACEAVSAVAAFGNEKYSRGNWMKGFPQLQLIDSLQRHLMAYTNGEDLDPESGLPHLSHVAWNAMVLIENAERYPIKDNRTHVV